MKILVVGGGGREAALCRKFRQSPHTEALYCAPGNAGIEKDAVCLPFGACDLDGICGWAERERPDFVFVAPDDPLALGMVDRLEAIGVRAFGPTAAAARIESSKTFAKKLMSENAIPTADYEVFTDGGAARRYLRERPFPLVIKADGLALGKGVFVCQTLEEAEAALETLFEKKVFGAAGEKVLIEDCLFGRELTVMLFTDGEHYALMPNSRDHKRAFDGDKGPNTGGMGVVCPGAALNADDIRTLEERIVKPTLAALRRQGCPFGGVLYIGLMLTDEGPKVIEYNARFGDPEAQTVLPLLETDLTEIVRAVLDGDLRRAMPRWRDEASCCVVMASEGYPGHYEKGIEITGIEEAETLGAAVYQAGTAWRLEADGSRRLVTAGGRVLDVVATRKDAAAAREAAYHAIERITFRGAYYRRDIGLTAATHKSS